MHGYPTAPIPHAAAPTMTELLIVLFVALLVFGATKVPAVGDALGRALRGPRARPRDAEPDAPPPPPASRRPPS